jgi:hypothetical protein
VTGLEAQALKSTLHTAGLMSERFFTSGTVPAKKASSKKNSSKRQKPSAEEANADKSRQKKKSRREQNEECVKALIGMGTDPAESKYGRKASRNAQKEPNPNEYGIEYFMTGRRS